MGKTIKIRNWHAVNAHMRSGAGAMADKKKEASKKACRDWKRERREG